MAIFIGNLELCVIIVYYYVSVYIYIDIRHINIVLGVFLFKNVYVLKRFANENFSLRDIYIYIVL